MCRESPVTRDAPHPGDAREGVSAAVGQVGSLIREGLHSVLTGRRVEQVNRELQVRQEAEPRRSAACCGASSVVCCGGVLSPEQASPRVAWRQCVLGAPAPVALGPTRVAPPRLACALLTCVVCVQRLLRGRPG